MIDGKWLSGVVDRLHVHRDAAGTVTRVEVVDFKTDVVASPQVLLARHADQMRAYQAALALAFPGAAVSCHLVSTQLRLAVAVGGEWASSL